ncbi:MAG: sensor histidine kinase [Gemmataceae bacterium]
MTSRLALLRSIALFAGLGIVCAIFAASYGMLPAIIVAAALSPLAAWWTTARAAQSTGEVFHAVNRLKAGDHAIRFFPGQIDDAELARAFNELSEQLEAEKQRLRHDREQLQMILTAMEEGVLAIDANECVLFANARARDLLQLPETCAGRKFWELFRQRDVPPLIKRALGGESPCQLDLELAGTQQRHVTVRAASLSNSSSRGVVLVLHDITELKRLERVRQEFVTNVSHELKTPLTVISACAETLLDGAGEEPARRSQFLERISDQTRRLNDLILDLLTLGRLESTMPPVEMQSVELDAIIQECVDRYRALAAAKEVTLHAGTLQEPTEAWADPEAVRQILDNLLDNAVKYTEAGGRIDLGCRGDGDTVLIEVADTGVGIPAKDLARVFERFYRVDKARSRELGGTGLGLAIVKHQALAMHGSVSVKSQVGQGSVFTVRLQRSAAASQDLHTRSLIDS